MRSFCPALSISMPRQHGHFGRGGKRRLGDQDRGDFACFHLPVLPRPVEKMLQRVHAEEMHGDYLRRLERLEHFDHSFEIKGIAAVDRDKHNVDAADLVELLLGERMMKVTEMGDAQICQLENKNGVAVPL